MYKTLKFTLAISGLLIITNHTLAQETAPQCKEVKAPDQDELKAEAGIYYFNDKLYSGIAKDCYDDGKVWYIAKYKDGLADGDWTMYREDGTTEYIINFKKGVKNGLMSSFNSEGVLEATVEFENDIRNGEYAQYYPNGQAAMKGSFLNDQNHGPINTYYQNGALNSKGEYVNGKPSGVWMIYTDSTGSEYMTGEYKDGLPAGDWKTYQGDSLQSIETFEGGKLVRTRFTSPPPEEIIEERGQKPMKVTIGNKPDVKETVVTEVLDYPDVEAEFIGGASALQKYIFENIVYPNEAIELGEQGKVYLSFVVEKDGSITNVTVEKSVSESLDAEAVRLLEAMPKWKPGEANGMKVRTKCMMPIVFVFADDDEEKNDKKKKRRK